MKYIVDTSIWISHLKKPESALIAALESGEVLIHSAVIGELSCGKFKQRLAMLSDLKPLPLAEEGRSEEVLEMIESRKLYGKGLGWIDCPLLASAKLSKAGILSHDRALIKVATSMDIPS